MTTTSSTSASASTQPSAASSDRRKSILVTGSSGATGGRVVALLLSEQNRSKYRVVALTRSREKLYSKLKELGVDNIRKLESEGLLRVIVSDMANVPADALFDVDCCVSCTGTKAGPPDDDAARSKYYQGIVRYPVEILEDTPENVEFTAVSRVVNKLTTELEQSSGVTAVPEASLFDFRPGMGSKEIEWGSLDDVVMGGVSESQVGTDPEKGNVLAFRGTVRTENNGGFASTRSANFDSDLDLSQYDGVQLRLFGDGNRYKFILRCDRKWDSFAHCVSFDTNPQGWQTVNIKWSDFNTVMRGKIVDGQKFDPSCVVAVQLMLSKFEYDGDLNPSFQPGNFELLVASIRPYVTTETAVNENVQWIHLSSAAVTRPLRMSEIEGTPSSEVPAVQMNAQIGNILNWKLAGEDSVKVSGLKYSILRPCALTMEASSGVEKLKFDQGDLMTGRVTRDDMAAFIVKVVQSDASAVAGKTFEVATMGEDEEVQGGLDERLENLKVDADNDRVFGPFPYVPSQESLKV